MPTFKISDLDKKAAPFKNDTKPASWQAKSGKKGIDYGQIEADQNRPTLFSDPSGWWAGLTDDQKQQVLDSVGELAGGTVGAAAGGGTPLSIPGAAAGAVAGRSLAKGAGKLAGLKTTPKTAKEELIDTATTAATNAGGEAIGAGMAFAKPLIKRGLQRAIKVDPTVASLAENAGLQLTPGMLSTNPLVKMGEAVLENTPGGMNTVRKATNEALAGNEANLRKLPARFNPTPVDRPEAGEALQTQLSGNRAAMGAEFKPKYQDVLAKAADAPIDASVFRQSARNFLEDLPSHLEGYFPSTVLKKLRQTAGMMNGTTVADGLIDGPVPVLSFQEAQQLRTGLLEAERAMTSGDAAVKRRAIPALRDALDRSIDNSLADSPNPAYQQALTDWRKTNKEYGETAQTLGGKGNPTGDVIERAKNPDSLVSRISNSPTAIREAETATTPIFGAADENAMGKLRRNRLDELINDSRTQHRWNQQQKIVNPDTLEGNLSDSDGMRELMQPVAGELKDNITLGRAIVGPSKLTNTSGTARFNKMLGMGTAAGGATYGALTGDGDAFDRGKDALIGGAIAGVAVPKVAAKIWTSPRFAQAITKPVGPMAAPILEPALGAATRGLMEMQQLPVPAPIEQPAAATPAPTKRFKLSDFE